MFGISFVELLIAALAAIFFIKPSDMPEIASYLGKIYAKLKRAVGAIKSNFEEAKEDIGYSQIKQDFNIAFDEQSKNDSDRKGSKEIVDIYGKTHYVMDIEQLRPDLDGDEIEKEISEFNSQNSDLEGEVEGEGGDKKS